MSENAKAVKERVARGQRILASEEAYDNERFLLPSEAAAAEFKEALLLDPDCYDALIGLGESYCFFPSKYGEAIEVFKRASDIRPGDAEPYYWLGKTYLLASERGLPPLSIDALESAIPLFQKALALDFSPKAWVYSSVGKCYFKQGEYKEACRWLEKSIGPAEEEGIWIPSTFFLLAEANEALGEIDEAIKWYELHIKKNSVDVEETKQRIKNLTILRENRKKSL